MLMNVWNIKHLNKGRRGIAQKYAAVIHTWLMAFRLEVKQRTLRGSHCSQNNIVFVDDGDKNLCRFSPGKTATKTTPEFQWGSRALS